MFEPTYRTPEERAISALEQFLALEGTDYAKSAQIPTESAVDAAREVLAARVAPDLFALVTGGAPIHDIERRYRVVKRAFVTMGGEVEERPELQEWWGGWYDGGEEMRLPWYWTVRMAGFPGALFDEEDWLWLRPCGVPWGDR